VADLNTGGGDGSWAASSGALACTGVISVSGAPDSGEGLILLIDGPYYEQFVIKATATLDTNAENAGLVFGYIDRGNFWARIYSKTQQKRLLSLSALKPARDERVRTGQLGSTRFVR